MKILLISCLAALMVGGLVGCSDDTSAQQTSTSQSATMQTDTKDMQHR
jgi:hypothetical protein